MFCILVDDISVFPMSMMEVLQRKSRLAQYRRLGYWRTIKQNAIGTYVTLAFRSSSLSLSSKAQTYPMGRTGDRQEPSARSAESAGELIIHPAESTEEEVSTYLTSVGYIARRKRTMREQYEAMRDVFDGSTARDRRNERFAKSKASRMENGSSSLFFVPAVIDPINGYWKVMADHHFVRREEQRKAAGESSEHREMPSIVLTASDGEAVLDTTTRKTKAPDRDLICHVSLSNR